MFAPTESVDAPMPSTATGEAAPSTAVPNPAELEALALVWASLPSVQKVHHEREEAAAAAAAAAAEAEAANPAPPGGKKAAVPPPQTILTRNPLVPAMEVASGLLDQMAALTELTGELLPAIYRACHANADDADSDAAIAKLLTEDVLAALNPKGDGLVAFGAFADLFAALVAGGSASWLPAEIAQSSSGGAVSPRSAIPAPPPAATPLVSVIRELVGCITDDTLPVPWALLPVAAVSTMSRAQLVPVALKAFLQRATYPTVAPALTRMWDALVAFDGVAATEDEPVTSVSESAFTEWFCLFQAFTVSNAMEERSRAAARTHFAEATAAEGVLTSDAFVRMAARLFTLYTRGVYRDAPERMHAHFEAMMDAAGAAGLKARPAAGAKGGIVVALPTDVLALYAPDDMDLLRALRTDVLTSAPENRVLVTGYPGTGKTTFAAALARALNVEHVSVLSLLVQCVLEQPDTQRAAVLRAHIDAGTPVPLELQAEVLRERLMSPAVTARGYVVDDLPPVSGGFVDEVERFVASAGLGQTPPQVVVDLHCPEALYAGCRENATEAWAREYEAERARREDERAAAAAAAQFKAQRSAAIARIEALEAARQQRRDAGEEEPEDAPEADPEDVALSQRPEDPELVDEDGAALDEEAIAAVLAARAKAQAERHRVSTTQELKRLILASRTVDDEQGPVQATAVPSIRAWAERAKTRNRLASIACFDATQDQVAAVTTLLRLEPAVMPTMPVLDPSATEGVERSPDSDAEIGQLKFEELKKSGAVMSEFGDYCPVTKLDDGVLQKGSWFYSCSYRGRAYCFASAAKLQRFVETPAPFLLQTPNTQAPVMLLQEDRSVLVGLDVSALEATLAQELDLTRVNLEAFSDVWMAHDAEVSRRSTIARKRREGDATARAGREERRRKLIAEAEIIAKKHKATAGRSTATGATPSGVVEKKKKAVVVVPNATPGSALGSTVNDAEGEAAAAETTDSRLAQQVTAAQQRRDTVLQPMLLTTLGGFSSLALTAHYERHILPELVVVFKNQPPRPDDEEAAMEYDAALQAEEEGDAIAEEEEAAAAAEANASDESPPKARNVLLDDARAHRRYVRGLARKMADDTEAAGDASEEAGALPRQVFRIVTVNVYGLTQRQVVDTVLYGVRDIVYRAAVADEEPLLTAEDDEEALRAEEEAAADAGLPAPQLTANGEPRDPLLRPGARSRHQYGQTGDFCPVSLLGDGILRRGDPSIIATYLDKKYIFATAAKRDMFLALPTRFLPAAPPAAAPLPPPRLWVMGPTASGKKSVAAQLRATSGMLPFSTELEALFDYLAAMTAAVPSTVRDVPIVPPAATNPFLMRAVALKKAYDDFAADQVTRQAQKDAATARQEAYDNADDDEREELTERELERMQQQMEWEPEEEEDREARVAKTRYALAAAISRVPPFADAGYVLIGGPTSDAELQGLVDAGMPPEAVLHITVSPTAAVERKIEAELAARTVKHAAALQQHRMRKSALQLFARVAELARWRRRNIGADDARVEPPELLETEEEPEAVDPEAVRRDLESDFDASNAAVQSLVDMLPDLRIPVHVIKGDQGRDAVMQHALEALAPLLQQRASLLETPQVLTLADATRRLQNGSALLSAYARADVVRLARARAGTVDKLRVGAPQREMYDEEEAVEPAAAAVETAPIVSADEEDAVEEPEAEDATPEEAAFDELEDAPEEAADPEEEAQQRAVDDAWAERRGRRVCLHRDRIYYFDTDETLLTFLRAGPRAFIEQAPLLPTRPGCVACVAEDASKSGLAAAAAANTGAVFVDVAALVQWAIGVSSVPALRGSALFHIVANGTEPLDAGLLELAVECRACSADVLIRGAVFQNLPATPEQHAAMLKHASLHALFVTPGTETAMGPVIQAAARVAHVVHYLATPAASSASAARVHATLTDCAQTRALRFLARRLGFPVEVAAGALPELNMRDVSAEYRFYCPWTWAHTASLYDRDPDLLERQAESAAAAVHVDPAAGLEPGDVDPELATVAAAAAGPAPAPGRVGEPRAEVVEFLGKVFYFSPVAGRRAEFMAKPELFIGAALQKKPKPLPPVLPSRVAPVPVGECKLCGFCPVVLHDTRRRVGLAGYAEPKAVRGQEALTVTYDGSYYRLSSETALRRFLAQPWTFVHFAALPAADRFPIEAGELDAAAPRHFMQRALRENLARALADVEHARPKFPGMSVAESALRYVALHLRAHNPGNVTPFAQSVHAAHMERFHALATVARDGGLVPPPEDAPAEEKAAFARRCAQWDAVLDDPASVRESFGCLQPLAPEPTVF